MGRDRLVNGLVTDVLCPGKRGSAGKPLYITLYVRRIEPNEPFIASFRLSPRYPVRALGPPTIAYEFACPSGRDIAAPQAVVVSKRPLR